MSSEINRVIVLDGGFSTQLAEHVASNIDGDPLWSARFNAVDPDAIIQTHLDFLNNGAEIILTNTYQASVEGYMEYLKLDLQQSVELIKSTVKLAHKARDKFQSSNDEHPLIFGSIGPFGAHLHDGSEYTGSYATTVSMEAMKKWHKVRIDACIEAGVDGLAIETIPCLMEAVAVTELILDEYPTVKFWVSFQCKDGEKLANGEDFAKSAQTIWDLAKAHKRQNLIAVGVNCLNPQFVLPLLKSLNGSRSKNETLPLVVYPNSGETYSVETGWQGKSSCKPLEDYVEEWIEYGARFIGGCCRTSATDIKQIRQKIDSIADLSNDSNKNCHII